MTNDRTEGARRLSQGHTINTVILEVRSLTDNLAEAARAMESGKGDGVARIGFATPELLWQVLTAKRWELLKASPK